MFVFFGAVLFGIQRNHGCRHAEQRCDDGYDGSPHEVGVGGFRKGDGDEYGVDGDDSLSSSVCEAYVANVLVDGCGEERASEEGFPLELIGILLFWFSWHGRKMVISTYVVLCVIQRYCILFKADQKKPRWLQGLLMVWLYHSTKANS